MDKWTQIELLVIIIKMKMSTWKKWVGNDDTLIKNGPLTSQRVLRVRDHTKSYDRPWPALIVH